MQRKKEAIQVAWKEKQEKHRLFEFGRSIFCIFLLPFKPSETH